jgi:asparagine synthase (glutamine-hydrolysing)
MSGIFGIVNLDGAPVDRDLAWVEGSVGFSQQPLTMDGNVCLIADARIDGDETILHAYQQWGGQCVDHLIGDFAFAIWDTRSRRLFCARDHFGVKPFFFARAGNSFIFGNRLNDLRREPRVSDALNETAIGDYLAFGLNQDPASTSFRDIQRLPGGHTLSIANGSLTTRRYWTPAAQSQIRFRKSEAYVERFNELLTTAVKDRLRGTDRVSISMSGGLDSTSLAAIARDLTSVKTYCNVYDKLIPDEERRYSAWAAASLGIPIHHLSADKYSLFQGPIDQPEPFLISPYAGQFHDLLRLASETSSVVLTGYDGDALMSEPRRSLRRFLPRIKKPKTKIDFPAWIEPSFAARTNLPERWEQYNAPSKPADEPRAATLRALRSKVWPALFECYDPGTTGLPLEARHPFIDLRLVNYLLAIPVKPWCKNKHILRRAMQHRLPTAILDRPKTPLAGNPALQLSQRAGVRWLDTFEVTPQLTRFVNVSLRRSLAEEKTPDSLWASLRIFALNHWLTHSLPIDRRMVA